MARWLSLFVAGLLSLCFISPLEAAPKKSKASNALAGLDASDPQVVQQAIEQAARLKSTQAAKALADRVRKGLPPTLLPAAIDALAAIRKPPAQGALAQLLYHRNPEVRAKAAQALAEQKAPGAANQLSALLDDPDAKVREAAANGLSLLGPDSAMPRLLAAASLGDSAAAAVVAEKARPTHSASMASLLGAPLKGPWASCIEKLLRRQDWPVKDRVSLAEKLLLSKTLGSSTIVEQLVSQLGPEHPDRKAFVSMLKEHNTQENPS
jgi:HEAT repeat protein